MFGNILALLATFLIAPTTSSENQTIAVASLRSTNPVLHPASYQAGLAHEKTMQEGTRTYIQSITDAREIIQAIKAREFFLAGLMLTNNFSDLLKYHNQLVNTEKKLRKNNPQLAAHARGEIESVLHELRILKEVSKITFYSIPVLSGIEPSNKKTERALKLMTDLEKKYQHFLESRDYKETFMPTDLNTKNDENFEKIRSNNQKPSALR